MDSSCLSIVIPTISGRDEWLHKCTESYRLTAPSAQVIVVKDQPSCGMAWKVGADQADRQYIHFTADDIQPQANWFQEAILCVDAGIVPACNVIDRRGSMAWCDSPLGDMGLWPNVLVPFLSRSMLDEGDWLLPIHYGSDDWVTYRAVQLGYDVRRCMTYKVTHLVAPEGRDYLRRHKDVETLNTAMKEAGYVPPVYAQLEINLRNSTTGLDSVSLRQLDMGSVRQQLNQRHLDRHRRRWSEG